MLPAAVNAGVPVYIERQFVKGGGDGSVDCVISSLSANQSLPAASSHGQKAR